MTEFGYTIIQTLGTDIAPDHKGKTAMNEVKAAEADAEAKYLAGTGIARQRQAIINGLRESVGHFQQDITDITSKDVMEMMMMTQYFDTMQHIGSSPGNSTIFVPSGPGAVADAAHAVRSGIMQGNIGAAATIGR